jgi:cell division protein FtsQ
VLGTAALLGGRWVLHEPIFRVEHVTLSGAHHETRAQVLAVTGLAARPAMIDVSTSAIAQDVERLPWVASARVELSWPNSLRIVIDESRVVGVASWHGGWVYVSATGANLGPAPQSANYPTLFDSAQPTQWPFATVGRNAAYVANRLPRAFSDQVREVVVNTYGSVSLVMTTPVQFVLGDTTQLHAKFVAIAAVIKNSTLVPGDVVNVTVPTELAVTTPKPG